MLFVIENEKEIFKNSFLIELLKFYHNYYINVWQLHTIWKALAWID
jgi:hypothetical protein